VLVAAARRKSLNKITKAVFPVAGMGTRFLPVTKASPKEMLPVVDKPLIQYAVEEAAAAGITDMIFITGRNKRAIEDHFDKAYELETELLARNKTALLEAVQASTPHGINCIYIRQTEALGLGHAVLCAEPVINNEPFAVLLADDLIDSTVPVMRQMTDIAQALHKAAAEVQQGHCATILPELQKIVQKDAHNFPALDLAGFCLKETGRTESALNLFERAAKENELSPVPVANAAGALLALGRKQEAEREYRHALTLDPTLPEAAANLAKLLRERGDKAGAAAVLDTALKGGAHSFDVFLERGLARAESGNLSGALADFREAAHRDPRNPVPLENAARAAYQLHQVRVSAQLYEELLRLAPGRLDLWKTLGAIYYYELGEKKEALRAFRQALLLERDTAEKGKLEALVRELEG